MKRLLWILLFVCMGASLSFATVPVETSREDYSCNGSTTNYIYPFMVYEDDDLVIVKNGGGADTTLVLDIDYTVNGAGDSGGGSIDLDSGAECETGYTLTMVRDVNAIQSTDYVDGQLFSAESMESALDRLTVLHQELSERNDRSLHLPIGDSSVSEITDPITRASTLLGFDDDGTIVYTTSSTADYTGEIVENYATLQAINITGLANKTPAFVQFRSSAGDGGGGNFYWDSSVLSTEVASDTQSGIYIPPNSDVTGASGAWVRTYSGAVNAIWFGASPLGVIGSAGAIQAAINYQAESRQAVNLTAGWLNGGGGVLLPTGKYICNSTIHMRSTVDPFGEARGSSQLAFPAELSYGIDNNYEGAYQSQFNLSNLELTQAGIYYLLGYQIAMTDVLVMNCRNAGANKIGILLQLTVAHYLQRMIVANCDVGIYVSSAGVGPATTLNISESYISHNGTGIFMSMGTNALHTTVIARTIIEYNDKGFVLNGAMEVVFRDIHFEGNTALGTMSGAIICTFDNCNRATGLTVYAGGFSYLSKLSFVRSEIDFFIQSGYKGHIRLVDCCKSINRANLPTSIASISGLTNTYNLNNTPIHGDYNEGDVVRKHTVASGSSPGWICDTGGTAGTLTGVTATTQSGVAEIIVNENADVPIDSYIAIAGVSGTLFVIDTSYTPWVSGTKTITVRTAPTASVTDAAVSYVAPVWIAMPNI